MEIGEGSSAVLSPEVVDPDGDPLTFAWDVDGDGTFGDSTQASLEWTAVGIDGPRAGLTVDFQVSDGTSTVTGAVVVDVVNVPPIFESEDPQTVAIGHSWSLLVRVTDPGDDALVLLPSGAYPDGATLDVATGLLRWTPGEDALGADGAARTWTMTVAAEDDDGATTLHDVDLLVVLDHPPPLPELLTVSLSAEDPRLSFSRVEDVDGDEVRIYADMDDDRCFCSPSLQSATLAQGDPSTEWRTGRPLDLSFNRQFFVRWWASDGVLDSERGEHSFVVEALPADAGVEASADASVEPARCSDEPGAAHTDCPPCMCRATAPQGTRGRWAPLAGAGLLLLLRRARSRRS